MSDIKNPEDSLSSYFDELLGAQETQDSVPQLAGAQLVAGASRVVALPQKSISSSRSEVKKLNLVPQLQSELAKSQLIEPEFQQSEAQKQKLERMLQTARTQLLIDAKPREDIQLKTAEVEPAKISGRFELCPDEIQDWAIESPAADPEISSSIVEPGPDLGSLSQISNQPAGFQLEGLEWLENGRPQWAQNRFDVLLFEVSGLTLAVPLIALGQIQPLTDELTPLFGQADWFMGLQPTPAGKIRTVNTAKFVMPERYDENFVKTAKYVVSINGVPWGLAVDSVNQPISLHPDDVKWRGDRSKRPWLAGTVKEHMCALLDIPRVGQMLVEADRNFQPA